MEGDERTEDKRAEGAEWIDALAGGGEPPPSPPLQTRSQSSNTPSACPTDWLGVAMVTDAAPSVAMPPLTTSLPSFNLLPSNSITQSHYATALGEMHARSEVSHL